jgi:cytochrome P450
VTYHAATAADTARIAASVLGPALAEGVIRRRPLVTRYAARHDLDGRAARTLARMRDRYGSDPLRLRVPGRVFVVVLDPQDVDDLLARTPDPFTPATTEKRAALRHFQPHGVLVSSGRERELRRSANETALDTARPRHRHAETFLDIIDRETAAPRSILDNGRTLDWSAFATMWWPIVRQIVFGPAARGNEALTDDIRVLRSDANWAYLRPRRRARQYRLHSMIRRYLEHPDRHSLVGQLDAARSAGSDVDLAGQVPHWLFAFDAAGVSAFRCLALIATHPEVAGRLGDVTDDAYARACLLDTVRLYPTTLMILRQAVRDTELGSAAIPAKASLIVHSGFFHRDRWRLAYADAFRPEIWLDGTAEKQPGIVPFSAGPAACPGRNLVELTAAATIGALAREPLALTGWAGSRPRSDRPLPAGLDHFSLGLTRPRPAYARD